MSLFNRDTPPPNVWRILLYCVLSAAFLLLLGKIGAVFQIG